VRRYVRRRRKEMARERDRRDAEGLLALSWLHGEVQVDLGEADLGVRGVVTRGKYPAAAVPHPDVRPAQVSWGETSECICQGLRSVFEFIGGVHRRAVFDNATEAGRRVGETVRLSELFRRFAAHYGLGCTSANPRSGNEKGKVKSKVGFHRRNLFVPAPSFHDVGASDRRLPGDSLDHGAGKRHHGLGTPEPELFGEDRGALSPLPPAALSCVRWETRRCSKQGVFTIGGVHRYLAGPAYVRREVAVALGAFDVTACDRETGEVVATHGRQWGGAPTDSSGPTLQLRLLCMRPAGWRDPGVRASLPAELAADLRVLRDESAERGWADAVEGMSRSLAATGGLDCASVALSAARAADELGARGRAGGLHIRRHHRRLPRLRDAGAGGGVHGDARVGGRPPRQGEAGAPARAGEVPRAEVDRGVRLVELGVPRRLGSRGHVLARVRARRGGPRVLRPDGARKDPHGHHARDRRDVSGLPREVLPDRAARDAAGQGQEGGDARQAARGYRQGKAPRPGRVRLRPLRCGRGEAPIPGGLRELREEERHIHHQCRARQVGHSVR
jgi:hypothetical protein